MLGKGDHQLKAFWAAVRPYLAKAGHGIAWFFRRFQVIRWLILILLSLTLAFSTWFTYKAKTANVQDIKSSLQTKTTLYDEDDREAGKLYGQKGTYVPLTQISPNIQNAVISTEDRSFYTNPGFDIKGIARAALGLVIHHGQITGGGSTITQQLAKNTLLSQKQTFLRKGQEIFLAVQLTRVYSKNDILTMYLNNAYFGNGVWGVEDASQRYFGKHASQLNAGEGATLAAMLRSPSFYNPIDHMDNAIARRNLVLGLEQDNGKLTAAQVQAAKATTLTLKDTYTADNQQKYPYFFDSVIEEAYKQDGISQDDIVNKGYRIYTTLNPTYQDQMQAAFDNDYVFPQNAADGTKAQAASVAVDPKTGGVLAVVGSRGPHVYLGFNYATQLQRQPGSLLKPLMAYTPALENGYSYDSELTDKKISYGKDHYTPTNDTGIYAGTMPMYKALADSTNAPAVWLLNQIGMSKGVASLSRFGINLPKKDQHHLGAVLGGVSTGFSPLTFARAYSAYASGGTLPQTHFIRKIVDATGKTVVNNEPSSKRIMKQSVATEMTSMMIGVYNEGTGQTAKPYGYTIAGKTGTVETPKTWGNGLGAKDSWVVGYTPDIVVATWSGFANTDATHYLQPGQGALKLYRQEMTNILPATPQTKFNTTDASARATLQTPNADNGGADLWSTIQNGIQNGVDSAKNTVSEWYNGIKGLLGN
ncbi:PBP1A family penicillin-binding protein [Lacticaseibacillus camelliae]|uniref:Penicillin-binding protein n=1 Tax=Lacticaseibacillus camelliae DSM 22697 = JCM 13995 TaxID=1423730 RepID=A0A0R2FCE6_9LACO|nr:penicillin-binding protein [Lacticaseibacillus camelliae DSM 22697 = JCM 13995]